MSSKQHTAAVSPPKNGEQSKPVNTTPAKAQNKSGEFQPHNARKESLGPNTNR